MIKKYIDKVGRKCEVALDEFVPSVEVMPATIHKAMRHSLFAGGKRLRPVAVVAAAEACGGSWVDCKMAACAIELMHTYSLVHDDLPCMDDDELRRGKPTCHVVYGEGVAVLAGDALLTASFNALACVPATSRWGVSDFIKELAWAGGSRQMIGGQVLDLEGELRQLSQEEVVRIHEGKTAALLIAAFRLGGMAANATERQLEALRQFGYNLGLAFQIKDDILDATATTEQLGKTAGKDEAHEKSTFVTRLGLEEARKQAQSYTTAALSALDVFEGDGKKRLSDLAEYLLNREK